MHYVVCLSTKLIKQHVHSNATEFHLVVSVHILFLFLRVSVSAVVSLPLGLTITNVQSRQPHCRRTSDCALFPDAESSVFVLSCCSAIKLIITPMISVENLAAAASPETTLYVYWWHSMGLHFPRHGSLTAFRVMPLDSFFFNFSPHRRNAGRCRRRRDVAWSVYACLCVCLLCMPVGAAKPAAPIETPYVSGVDSRRSGETLSDARCTSPTAPP